MCLTKTWNRCVGSVGSTSKHWRTQRLAPATVLGLSNTFILNASRLGFKLRWQLRTQKIRIHSTGSILNVSCVKCTTLVSPKFHSLDQFEYNKKIWNLVNLPKPEDSTTPYIVLESMNLEKNSSRIIHTIMIKGDKKKFSLGRGHDSDLWINDISVSRLHATIDYRDGDFYLEDCKSKFGTLVHIRDDIPIELN